MLPAPKSQAEEPEEKWSSRLPATELPCGSPRPPPPMLGAEQMFPQGPLPPSGEQTFQEPARPITESHPSAGESPLGGPSKPEAPDREPELG